MELDVLEGAGILLSLSDVVELWNASNADCPVHTFWELFASGLYDWLTLYHPYVIASFDSYVPREFGNCGSAVADNQTLGHTDPTVIIWAFKQASLFEAAYQDAEEIVTEIQLSNTPLTNGSQSCHDFLAARLCLVSMALVYVEDDDPTSLGMTLAAWGAKRDEEIRRTRLEQLVSFAEGERALTQRVIEAGDDRGGLANRQQVLDELVCAARRILGGDDSEEARATLHHLIGTKLKGLVELEGGVGPSVLPTFEERFVHACQVLELSPEPFVDYAL